MTVTIIPKLDGNKSLKEADPVLYEIIRDEEKRQFRGLELIASEVCGCLSATKFVFIVSIIQ